MYTVYDIMLQLSSINRNKGVKMDHSMFVYVFCNGCQRYIHRADYPQNYGWCLLWLAQDCTVEISEQENINIELCQCVEQKELL